MPRARQEKANKGKARQMPGAIRSRRGCLVCRRRHKKCDEEFKDGSCERCRAAGLECLLPPAENRSRYSGTTYEPARRQPKSDSPTGAGSSRHATGAGTIDNNTSDDVAADGCSIRQAVGPSTYVGASVDPFDSELPILDDIDNALGSLPLLASSSSTLTPMPVPSSSLVSFGSPSADIPSSATWDPFSDCFASPSTLVTAAPQPPLSTATYLRSWVGNSGGSTPSATDFLRSIQPWTDVVFGHLPPSHFESANTRFAISALTHKYVSPDTRLTRDIYSMIHDTWLTMPHRPSYFGAMSVRSGTSKLARDLVVKAFEELVPSEPDGGERGRLELTFLYEQAVQRLVSCGEMALSDRMHIISDLQLFSFAASGAKQAYEAVALADDYFRALGSEKQVSSFMRAALVDSEQDAALKLFVGMDLCRAIARPGSRPLLPMLKPYETAAENEAAHMVLFPFEIAVVLSQVCHLQAARLLPADVETEAGALELMLVLVDEGRASRPWVIHLWKLAARALVYQRLRRVGPLHPVLQSVGADLVREFGCRYPPGESAVEKSLALPLFLAGSLALGQADRDVVRTRWATLKPERGWQEPLALLERVWSEMDATGDSVRWDEVVQSEGWSIAFF